MSFWYPRLNSQGVIAGGNGTISIRDGEDRDIGDGHSPQWMTDETLMVAGRGDGTVLLTQDGARIGAPLGDFSPRVGNVSGISAGAGHWCGWAPERGLVYDGLLIDAAAAPGCIDQATGQLAYLSPYQAEVKDIILNGQVVRSAAATEIMAGEQSVAWGEYVNGVRRLFGWCPETGVREVSPLPATELLFIGVPVRTPHGLWLVTQTNRGLIVYPWGETSGYIVEGDAYYHHARWVNDLIIIVSTDGAGLLRELPIDLDAPRTDLMQYFPSTGGSQPPEPPKPEDTMKPPIVTVDRWTLDDVLDGREFVFHDEANPELGYRARVVVQGGSMHAELTNAKGSASTGAQRTVHPCSQGQPEPPEPPDPEPEPEPEPLTQFTLKRDDGGYACVGQDKFLLQGNSPATFEVVPQPNGKIGLLCNGKFLAAESDDRCKADRDSVGDWEEWDEVLVDEDDQSYAYQSWRGKYLSFHDDGSIKADMDDVGGWETLLKGKATGGRLPITGPLSVDGGTWFFRDSWGQPWRARGVTAFPLCRRYVDGGGLSAIQPFLDAFPGYNYVRLFDYVTWPDTGWESCTADEYRRFCADLAPLGWYVELCLLTDDDPARIEPAKRLLSGLSGIPNLLIEIGNEPRTNKSIDTTCLKSACEASGLLFASGDYEDNANWFGRYGTAHTPRDEFWSRKAHELMEFHNGGGPHYPTAPACKAPWIADEPIRPDEATTKWCPKWQDYQAYGGVAAILGAGALFHYGGGRFAELPNAEDCECRDGLLRGLLAFEADVPGGSYRTIDEEPDIHDETGRRTYVVGERTMVRVRPTSPIAPEPGWTPLDDIGILWKR